MMKTILVKNEICYKCRICLEDGSVPIYNSFVTFNVSEYISLLSGIEIKEDDIYPKHICETCFSTLQNVVDFRKTAQETDRKLRSSSEEASEVMIEVLFEDSSEQNDVEFINYLNDSQTCLENGKKHLDGQSTSVNTEDESMIPKGKINNIQVSNNLFENECIEKNDKQIQCKICNRYVLKCFWVRHCSIHKQSQKRKEKCKACNFEALNFTALFAHMKAEHGEKYSENYFSKEKHGSVRTQTSKCRSEYNAKLLPSVYAKIFKPTNVAHRVECTICNKSLLSTGRKDHYASHDPEAANRYQCEICKKGFVYKPTYKHHKTHCEALSKYQSKKNENNEKICEQTSKIIKKLSKEYKCNGCSRSFSHLYTLLKHMRTHHGLESKKQNTSKFEKYYKIIYINHQQMVQCRICQKTLKKASFNHHIKLMHLNLKSKPYYLCEVCGKSYNMQNNYKIHMLSHGNEFNFKCKLCPYRGRSSGLLNSHMRLHNRRIYQCDICSKICHHKCNLIRHIRGHGEPGFECNVCNKRFYHKFYLTRHMDSIHFGVKRKNPCEKCDKVFASRKFLFQHQKKVHGMIRTSNGVHARAHYKPELENS